MSEPTFEHPELPTLGPILIEDSENEIEATLKDRHKESPKKFPMRRFNQMDQDRVGSCQRVNLKAQEGSSNAKGKEAIHKAQSKKGASPTALKERITG